MKWDIFFEIRGPCGQLEAPNSSNPVDCESLQEVLKVLSEKFPPMFGGAEIVGVRVIKHEERRSDV